MQGIPAAKILETMHIVRFALSTKVVGEAEPVFDVLRELLRQPRLAPGLLTGSAPQKGESYVF